MTSEQKKLREGFFLAISAYMIWGGITPIYFNALSNISSLELLSHRIIWSFLLLIPVVHFSSHWDSVFNTIKSIKTIGYLVLTATLISSNWLIFILAISTNRMLDASLGYYINPLFNVLLGLIFLKERLRKMQWLAVFLVVCGVLVQCITFGSIPVISILLAMTFGIYGLLRKKINLDVNTGLFIEVMIMLPIAIGYLFFITESQTSNLMRNSTSLNFLLITSGIITILPMLCFIGSARKLKLSTLSFFQYIAPSLIFLLAVLKYDEIFSIDKIITFSLIWVAMIIFAFDGMNPTSKNNHNL
ncbi:rarD protein (plasmid) [Candidatus Photodesmus katoptron]|uniref:RarD protein n=1 Tax=Candidatus Photodesmus katoptron Akat1 TaxID=1236703 RepID=S3DJ55_9GAMM|nr:EamA family transporter RarD [Candidatus Photodesmus katoptron]EPE37179.1 RarD protein [Candidatus Photodesmus katoptron Akat1]KEY90051.1 rarD protein [Candidatus Photodesmus katoptron]